MSKYGKFLAELGGYSITNLPKVGNYEYIHKNDELLLKLDQFGLSLAQINPPVGDALLKREKREISSLVSVYFDFGKGVFNCFDVFKADSVKIDFLPHKSTYSLTFGDLVVKTDIVISSVGARFVVKTEFENTSDKPIQLTVLPRVYPYVNPLLMAPWDKPEWYTKTEYLGDCFLTTKFSVSGNKAERKYFLMAVDKNIESIQLSSERLIAKTDNFSVIPKSVGDINDNVVYSFEQCFSGLATFTVGVKKSESITLSFDCVNDENCIDLAKQNAKKFFDIEYLNAEIEKRKVYYENLFSIKTVQTKDQTFNRFVNGFLPLELSWVSALDRGWPTGMRGVRDASNDFQGYLSYDKGLCRSVITNIFSKQRSDGWYPRQVPFGDSDKFDLRHFVDSACFFTEYVYEYLSYTEDYSILEEFYPYYDSKTQESGLTHLIKGIEYLTNSDYIGEHGLVKIQGGDWLDCLSSAGLKGRGETVMVSCQLVMSIEYLTEILSKLGRIVDEKYGNIKSKLIENINKFSYNDSGFYNGVFTDEGEWVFSDCDPDGEKRVYAPTNAYAIISGVAKGKEAEVAKNLLSLKTENGFVLFSKPFGFSEIKGIGKMGTGDFQPYFAENGSVYNHGSQCFVLRALSKIGNHKDFYDLLNFALPINGDYHREEDICGAPYAITNCYHLVPSFKGRMGFSFLTGSVAMVERAIYNWLFGVNFTISNLVITPCVPEPFGDSQIVMPYLDKKIMVKYNGFGSKIQKAKFLGQEILVESERSIKLDKDNLVDDSLIEVWLV